MDTRVFYNVPVTLFAYCSYLITIHESTCEGDEAELNNSVEDFNSSRVGVVCRLSVVCCVSPVLKIGLFLNALS